MEEGEEEGEEDAVALYFTNMKPMAFFFKLPALWYLTSTPHVVS